MTLLTVTLVRVRRFLRNDDLSALTHDYLWSKFFKFFFFALAIYFRVCLRSVFASRDSGIELHGAVEASEDLIFRLFEMFLTVDMVHFDVQRPALSDQYFVTTFVGTFIMIFKDEIILLSECPGVETRAQLNYFRRLNVVD